MIDVFVRAMPQTRLREWLLRAVLERVALEVEPENRWVIAPKGSPIRFKGWQVARVPAEDFHRQSKHLAARLSITNSLIILDDDQLPLYRGWVAKAQEIFKKVPEFSAVAGWSVTHEVPKPKGEVEFCDSIGCPMIVSLVALLMATDHPIDDKARADTILTKRLRRFGPTGIARDWRYVHAGIGLSQVIPQHWMPEVPA